MIDSPPEHTTRTAPALPPGSLVLITGVNGYVGSHVAHELLARGYRVRGTARDLYKAGYMHELFAEAHAQGSFTVEIVEDMAAPGAFDHVVRDCSGLIHTASDLSIRPDPHAVITPVLRGVRNALHAAAATPSVTRVVYTSSSAALTAPLVDTPLHLTPATWNDADVARAWAPPPYHPARALAVYAASKTQAERECWHLARGTSPRPRFVLNTVCPNCVVGKILGARQPASTGGWFRGLWRGDRAATELLRDRFAPQHWVNATDAAVLHVAALLERDVEGERLLGFAGPFGWNDTVEVLERLDRECAEEGRGKRRWERIVDPPRDLITVDTRRSEELLRRYGRDGFTGLEQSLREAVGL